MEPSCVPKLIKWGLFLIPIGSLVYMKNRFDVHDSEIERKFDENTLSDLSKDYIKQNNLICLFSLDDNYENTRNDYFFENKVMNELKGLTKYHIFLDKAYYEVLNKNIPAKEKLEFHKKAKIHCIFSINTNMQGHFGISHGGFTTTLFDNLTGMLASLVTDMAPNMTGSLNIAYKKPVKIEEEYIAVAEVEKIEDDKVFLSGKVIDPANNVYVTIGASFVKVSGGKQVDTSKLHQKLQLIKNNTR